MNTEIVFGTCDYAASDGSHAFFRVEGCVDEQGEFVWLQPHETRRMYPTKGTIRVLRLSNKGHYGMFRLVEDHRADRYESGANGVRFRASPTTSTVYQVWRAAEPSSNLNVVAKRLAGGIRVMVDVSVPTSIFVLFADDVLCGPIRLRTVPNQPGVFTFDPQSLVRPCAAWSKRGGVELREISVRNHGNLTLTTAPIGEPTTYIDFAPIELALKKVLEQVRQIEGAATQLTPAKIQELSVSLAKIVPEEDLKPRIVALRNRLNAVDAATSDFAELLQRCLALSSIQLGIEREITKAKQAAVAKLAMDQAEAVEALNKRKGEHETLALQIADLSTRKAELASELERIEVAIGKSREKFVEAVAHEARKAEEDVEGFLARLVALRPFLSQGTVTPLSTTCDTEHLKAERMLRTAKQISTADAGVKHLTSMLARFGIARDISAKVATEVIAALVLGQPVAFRGSLATLATAVVSQSLSGSSLAHVEVPVGTRRQINIRSVPDNQALGIIINGANCSCIDAYGGDLIETIRLRVSGLLPRATPPYVFFCLREGPSTLLPTVQMAELGPIFHTDTWKWFPQPSVLSVDACQLTLSQLPSLPILSGDFYDDLRSQFVGIPATAFLSSVRLLLPLLTQLYKEVSPATELAREAAVDSLVNSWVLPFLVAHKAKIETISACVKLAKDEQMLQQHLNLLTASLEC